MMWIVCVAMYISDFYQSDSDDSLAKPLITPIVVCFVLQMSRYFTVSTRHGTTPPNLILALSEKKIERYSFQEGLILFAWLLIKPEDIMREIETAMVRMQVSPVAFKIKTLSPIYPPFKEKFTNPEYYRHRQISIKQAVKDERK